MRQHNRGKRGVKALKKKFAYLMACSVAFSQVPVTTFATTSEIVSQNADLAVSLNLEYPVKDYSAVDLKVVLLKEQQVIEEKILEEAQQASCYAIFEDLPLGNYQIRLEGKGYQTYTSDIIELGQSQKQIVVNAEVKVEAGSGIFAPGDVSEDGVLDAQDLTQMQEVLGTNQLDCDLNGDQLVDIEDLAQLYWSQNNVGKSEVHYTKTLLPEVLDDLAIETEFSSLNQEAITVEGAITELFDGNEETVVAFKREEAITEEAPLHIPVNFKETINVSEISITAPGENAPTAGFVVYEDENGEMVRIPFTTVETESGKRASQKVIKIQLGKQIPLQKLTIEVTQTNSSTGLLAAISKIEFLEDVVEQSVNQEQSIVKNFKGSALDEGVSLSWNAVANATRYKVSYGTQSGSYQEASYTDTNSIVIEGLENQTEYYFVVQAINGDWTGPMSKEIALMPTPQKKPAAPTEVALGSFDKALKVGFRTGSDALSANIYYKKVTDEVYTKVEKATSGMLLRNLENDVEYMVYVTAQNGAGESEPSNIMSLTPVTEELVIPDIPTVNRLDASHITEIKLLDNNNINTNYYPDGFDINNIIDGDFTSHWTAATYQRDRGFSATFDDIYEMDYVAFTPRLDSDLDRYEGNRKYWEYPYLYTIKVWETLESEPKTLVSREKIPNIGTNGLMILPFEKTQVAKMEVYLYEWDGAGAMTISDVMFYTHQDLIERIDDVFADGTYTKVKDGIDIEQINALIEELDTLEGAVLWVDKSILKEELLAAKAILNGDTPDNLGEIIEVVQTRQTGTANVQNFAVDGLSGLQATGVMGYAGDEIIVYVDAPEGGNMPELVATQYHGNDTWSQSIALEPGRNVIQVPQLTRYNVEKGGALYLTYSGEVQETTTVRIVNAHSIPTLELADLEDELAVREAIQSYIEELTVYMESLNLSNKAKNPANATEIGTDKVLLSLPAEEVYSGLIQGIEEDLSAQVERLYESLMTWDANIKLHYSVLGLTEDDKDAKHRYPASRINVRYMPMNNGIFMYAAGDHIGIQYDSGAALVQGNRSLESGYFGWGINHEIGHIINDENFIVSETTNNIFSLFGQTINGGKSRLETSEVYSRIYDKVISQNTGLASDVFVNLGMFWQLHLAYDEGSGIGAEDFYPTLHRLSREVELEGLDAINYFIRLASDTVEKDLTPFFERWGMHISEETYNYTSQYEPETRALYYLNDGAMRYRLNDGTGMSKGDTASITATVGQLDAESTEAQEQVVTLNLTSDMDEEALLGYEIYRGNERIAFTTESTYTDKVSANNVSYTYSVVAYDKLLNTTEKATSNEVYIASEGTISKSEYEIERKEDSSIQVTLPNTPEVVGLKLTDVTEAVGTDYTVEVSQDGEKWTVAKQSKLREGSTLVYFNKPGVNEEDDRIWTYDAQYIRITGEGIAHLSDEQIDILSYPGDGVYFTENAIGYLSADYDFGQGVIPKDTLVVMGTYRGHPLYSKIVLSAQYVNEKDYDQLERPNYTNEKTIEAIEGELYMFAEVPEDQEVSKVGNGIWLFVPKSQTLPSQIKANMFRTDAVDSVQGGRLVSDTKWLIVPSESDLPTIELE